ncbi:hypothetical protein L228DRAFT_268288 [Xylona heveae TC161]|uniref:Uncharacterized protein n=1 Tax=Xylona heveae (strain CBS 132557 / TC161) TaxID=1328760 RepID=A0A165H306_XYLHT|nr:hypothetical protein L228DRAFT_268288 [Xylona heveae TC161]KZF22916.1 hypothetical protein L228DRAFT_268288 [Xylona heveae TC161]
MAYTSWTRFVVYLAMTVCLLVIAVQSGPLPGPVRFSEAEQAQIEAMRLEGRSDHSIFETMSSQHAKRLAEAIASPESAASSSASSTTTFSSILSRFRDAGGVLKKRETFASASPSTAYGAVKARALPAAPLAKRGSNAAFVCKLLGTVGANLGPCTEEVVDEVENSRLRLRRDSKLNKKDKPWGFS